MQEDLTPTHTSNRAHVCVMCSYGSNLRYFTHSRKASCMHYIFHNFIFNYTVCVHIFSITKHKQLQQEWSTHSFKVCSLKYLLSIWGELSHKYKHLSGLSLKTQLKHRSDTPNTFSQLCARHLNKYKTKTHRFFYLKGKKNCNIQLVWRSWGSYNRFVENTAALVCRKQRFTYREELLWLCEQNENTFLKSTCSAITDILKNNK